MNPQKQSGGIQGLKMLIILERCTPDALHLQHPVNAYNLVV